MQAMRGSPFKMSGSPAAVGSPQPDKSYNILNNLKSALKCESLESVEKAVYELLRFKDETDRILFILKSNFQLP